MACSVMSAVTVVTVDECSRPAPGAGAVPLLAASSLMNEVAILVSRSSRLAELMCMPCRCAVNSILVSNSESGIVRLCTGRAVHSDATGREVVADPVVVGTVDVSTTTAADVSTTTLLSANPLG